MFENNDRPGEITRNNSILDLNRQSMKPLTCFLSIFKASSFAAPFDGNSARWATFKSKIKFFEDCVVLLGSFIDIAILIEMV